MAICYGLQYQKLMETKGAEVANARCVVDSLARQVQRAQKELVELETKLATATNQLLQVTEDFLVAGDQGPFTAVEQWKKDKGRYPI